MKGRLIAVMLMAGGALFAETHVAIGVSIGRPAPVVVPVPVPANAYRPPCPGPGYVWVGGYYDEFGNWYGGYWTLPPHAGAYWVAPRFTGGHFYAGYWGGPRGVYRPETRVVPPAHERGPERAFDRPAPERYGNGFHESGHGPGHGPGRGADARPSGRR